MSEQTVQLVETLRRRLRVAFRRITLAELTFGGVLIAGVWSAVWVLSVSIEASFWLAPTPRTALFWTVLGITTVLFVYFLVLPVLRLLGWLPGPSEEAVARRVGERYPEVADRLVNLLHLAQGRHTEAPSDLIEGAVQMLGREVAPVAFEHVEDFGPARSAGRLASIPLVGLLVFLLVAPATFLDASRRILSPGTFFQRPAPFAFFVEPGSVELVRGTALDLHIQTRGETSPDEVTLSLNLLGEEPVETLTLTRDASGQYHHTVVNVRRSLRYRVEAGTVTTPWYTATVTERPIVRSLQVALDFPAYTRIPPQRLDPNVGDLAALPGTRVSIDAGFSGQAVTEGFIRFDDGSLDTLALQAQNASGSFTLQRTGSYQILLRNGQGVENQAPITYQMKLLDDAYPAVVLLQPETQAELNEALHAGLRIRIHDDFGFSGLRLFYRLAESRFGVPSDAFQALPLPLTDRHQLDQEIDFDWFLSQTTDLDPVPGDVIEYYVAVWDNDAVAGFKATKTPPHRLRMPSLTEQYQSLEETGESAMETMEKLLEEAASVQEQFEQLQNELRRKPESEWEDQRQLEQLQQKQAAMEERVNALSEQIESMTEQMQENNLVSEETLEMFQELQKVAEEINTPELSEALRQLQEAIQNLNLQQMQEAMQQFQFNESQYQQRLERTLELFKQLRVQQGLEEVARRAEDLARQEERLAQETGALQEQNPEDKQADDKQADDKQADDKQADDKQADDKQADDRQADKDTPDDREALAHEQERAAEEMKDLEAKLKELAEQMKDVRNAPKEDFEQLNEQVQEEQLPEQMKENAEQLRNNELQPAQQGQQQMQQQLQRLQKQAQQMQSAMQGQQMQLNMAGLRRALSDILTLSERQEKLREQVRGLSSESPSLRRFAQEQVELTEGLSVISDSLQSLARNIPQMSREVQKHAGETLREMGSATEAMADRIARRASGHQKGAMTNLNELALLLSDLLNQMMNGQGGAGNMSMQQMLQQLQQMAGQQEQLNQQIQQLLNSMQGNRLSQDMQERLRQLAGQQEDLRNQLKQMGRNRDLKNKVLGDLNRIAEQMEETIQDLQQSRVNRKTVERQQQILTRLLEASRSMQERGRENRREGRTGTDIRREGPAELTPAERADKLRHDLLRALDSGYAPDFQELIKRYFELLQEQAQEQE